MEEITKYIQENITWIQEQQMHYANNHYIDAPRFKVGNLVYIDTRNWCTERPAKKLDDKYAGPWPVTRIVSGSKEIEVKLPPELQADGIFNVFHPKLLHLYLPDPVPLQEKAIPKPVIQLNKNTGESEEHYIVDEIVDCRQKNKQYQYRVK